MLQLTSGKTLALNEVLNVPNIKANIVSIALLGKVGVKVSFSIALLGKVGVKVSFESNKIVMTKKIMSLWEKGFVMRGSLCLVFMKL